MTTLAERAWYAYQCLPRRGKSAPSYKSLEQPANPDGPSAATFSKLFRGDRAEPRAQQRDAIARVLHVDVTWLERGIGEAPTLTGAYKPMPLDESLRDASPDEWARKYAAIGGPGSQDTNFRIAVLYFGAAISSEAIEVVAREAAPDENAMLPVGWGKRLEEEQRKIADARAKPKREKAPPKVDGDETPKRRSA